MASGKAAGKAGCPICGKPTAPAFKPFCSERCRQVDLHRWFSGSYRIPESERLSEDDGDDAPGGKNQSESDD